MSAGVKPMSMPCRAATNPAAQNTAAPTPQAMPMAMEWGGLGLIRSGVMAGARGSAALVAAPRNHRDVPYACHRICTSTMAWLTHRAMGLPEVATECLG